MASCYMTIGGVRYKDIGIAKRAYDAIGFGSVQEAIENGVKWIVEHCENVNDVAVENAMQCMFYDFIGVSNQSIWDGISKEIGKYMDKGLIEEW